MTDRESIVAMLRKQAKEARVLAAQPCDMASQISRAALGAAAETFADQIERGDDLIPAKPKATIADLLALHDLDLGALAHKVGVTGEGFTTAQAETLCAQVDRAPVDEDFVRDVAQRMDGGWLEDLRTLAGLGAKVRAALSAPTIKVATPRVLQSADEAPRGSLVRPDDDHPVTICYPDGRGWHIYATALEATRKGWLWKEHGISGPVTIIAEGLTEAECRHLSGLSAADALAWCEKREAARRA